MRNFFSNFAVLKKSGLPGVSKIILIGHHPGKDFKNPGLKNLRIYKRE
jgi:hypothetical protein